MPGALSTKLPALKCSFVVGHKEQKTKTLFGRRGWTHTNLLHPPRMVIRGYFIFSSKLVAYAGSAPATLPLSRGHSTNNELIGEMV